MMYLTRRSFVVASGAVLISTTVTAAPPSGLDAWLQIPKIIGDIAEGLDNLVSSIDDITEQTMHRIDWFKGRSLRDGLIVLSARFSAVIADQKDIQIALDRYGDMWRDFHRSGHMPTPGQQYKLQAQWTTALGFVRSIARKTSDLLFAFRKLDSDLVLDRSYLGLQEALKGKIGILDQIARSDPPSDPDELKNLVVNEEAFLAMRALAKDALEKLNEKIAAIPH